MKSIIDQLILNYNQEYTFTKNLEDSAEIVKEMMNDDQCYNLIAGTNSGKTFSLLKIAHQSKIKSIMVVPLIAIADQKPKELMKRYKIQIGCVIGEMKNVQGIKIQNKTSDYQLKKILANENMHVIITTYDSLKRIVELGRAKIGEYVLLVDEVHNLVTQYNFRYKAIDSVLLHRSRFRKFINVTATPEGTLIDEVKTVQFSKAGNNPPKLNINLKYYKGTSVLNELLIHLKTHPVPNKTVIYIDNEINLILLKEAITLEFKEQAHVLTSKNKGDEIYNEMIQQQDIPSGIKYLLTTRMLSDGVNIFGTRNNDSKVDAFYIINSTDFSIKRQFVKRFRDGVDNVYEFTKMQNGEPVKLNIKRRLINLEKIVGSEPTKDRAPDVFYINQTIKHAKSKGIRLEPASKKFLIRNGFLQYLYRDVITSSFELTKEFYEKIGGFSVTKVEEECSEQDLDHAKSVFTEAKKNILKDPQLRSWIKGNMMPLLFDYLPKVHPMGRRRYRSNDYTLSEFYIRRLIFMSPWIVSYCFRNYEFLNTSPEYLLAKATEVETYIKNLLQLIMQGCSYDLVIEVFSTSLDEQDPSIIEDFRIDLNHRLDFELIWQYSEQPEMNIDFLIEHSVEYKNIKNEFILHPLKYETKELISTIKIGDDEASMITTTEEISADQTYSQYSNKEFFAKLKKVSNHRTRPRQMLDAIFETERVAPRERHTTDDILVKTYKSLTDLARKHEFNLNKMTLNWDEGLRKMCLLRALTLIEQADESKLCGIELDSLQKKHETYELLLLRLRN